MEPPAASAARGNPIRLVVGDDRRRSRLTVAFRLLLALPHVVWASLFGAGVFVVAFIGWWAALIRGRVPEGLHKFLAGYLRYATHVEAYVFLAANPFPAFYFGDVMKPYPIDLEIGPPQPQRRIATAFRIFLALPALVIAFALAGGIGAYTRAGYYGTGFGVAGAAALLLWFAAIFRARAPRGLRDLATWGIGYGAQAGGYLCLLTDRYPTSDPLAHVAPPAPEEATREQPARGVVRDDLRRSRLTVFFRLPLAAPHLVWLLLWTVAVFVAAILNWFIALVVGRTPRPFQRFLSAYVRYGTHVSAFVNLVANPFPGFVGRQGSYPIDIEVALAARQRRLGIAFRLLLAVPALLVNGAANTILSVVGLLGWFASLARGRMPEGLRNAGAWAIAYNGQAAAYALLLSDRYPYSSPNALAWPR